MISDVLLTRSQDPLDGFFGLNPVKAEEGHVPAVYHFSHFLKEWATVSGGVDGEGTGWQVKMRQLIDSLPFVQWGGGGTYIEQAKTVLFLLRLVESDFWAVNLEKERALVAVSRLLKFDDVDELERLLGGFCDLRLDQSLGALLALLDRSRFSERLVGNGCRGALAQIKRFVINCHALSRFASNKLVPLDGRTDYGFARLSHTFGTQLARDHDLICRIMLKSGEHELLIRPFDESSPVVAAHLAAEALGLSEAVDIKGFVEKALSCQKNRDGEVDRLHRCTDRDTITRKEEVIWYLQFISRFQLECHLCKW